MRAAATLLLALLFSSCTPPDLAFDSPDGMHTAYVRNRWSIDPPRHSLGLDDTHLLDLGEDTHWCRNVAWSRDGATVAFLVRDEELVVVDVATRRITATHPLPERNAAYEVCRLVLSDDGRTVSLASATPLPRD